MVGGRSKLTRSLARECDEAAAAILADAMTLAPVDGSLRGAAALLLADHEAGTGASLRPEWTRATLAAVDELDGSFFDGMLGSAWVLARIRSRALDLDRVDTAVLDALGTTSRWDGALAPFSGGLAGFGLYGLGRRTSSGKRIVARCVALFEAIAVRSGSDLRWRPDGLPRNVSLLNLEGSAAAVAFLAAAARAGVARALPLAKTGGKTLTADLVTDTSTGVGAATHFAVPGVIHGSGTWALGSAGVGAALLGVALATGARRELAAATRFARAFADADPLSCRASDASLGTGTAGIAVVLHAFYEATAIAVFRNAAEHWYRRTLQCRTPGGPIGGYVHYDALRSVAEGGGRWSTRPGLLDGAIGTALALRCAARGARSICRDFLLL